MEIILFTEIPTRKTVKPFRTVFLNSTGQDLVFRFVTAPDLMLPAFTISQAVSAAIDCIRLGAVDYYSSHRQNYAIASGRTAVLTLAQRGLEMVISA